MSHSSRSAAPELKIENGMLGALPHPGRQRRLHQGDGSRPPGIAGVSPASSRDWAEGPAPLLEDGGDEIGVRCCSGHCRQPWLRGGCAGEDAGGPRGATAQPSCRLARSLRLQRKTPEPGQVDIRQTVVLSPLPCWKHLTPEAYRARVAELIRQIEVDRRRAGEKRD